MIASSIIWKAIILPTILLAGNVYPQQADIGYPKLKGSISSSLSRGLRRKVKTTTTSTTLPQTTDVTTTVATTTQHVTSTSATSTTSSTITTTSTSNNNNDSPLLVDYLYTYGAVSVSNPAISNPDNKCSKFYFHYYCSI